MATDNLSDKIQLLKQQIRQSEIEIFNATNTINDSKTSTGDKKLDDQLRAEADTARRRLSLHEHKLASRRPMLAALEEEQKSLTTPFA